MSEPHPLIPLAWPDIGPEEEAEVLEVLRSGRLAMGPKTTEFERMMAGYTGSSWAAAVSSGTGGLHLAVRALEIGTGDCVVMPSFSFISSANAVGYEGAEPVFLDIDPATLCLSPARVSEYLQGCKEADGSLFDPQTGRRVAAVMSTDVFGHPANLEGLLDAIRDAVGVGGAEGPGIPLLSDSCESLGSRYRRRDGTWVHAGADARAAVFGFYPNKQITTGEGGMVCGSDPGLQERIESMRNQGRAAGDPWLRHTRIGFNYRLDEMSAALGVAQMRRIEEILGRRETVAAWYRESAAGIDGVRLPESAGGTEPAWFVEFARVDPGIDRDQIVRRLVEEGIDSKAYFDPPLHRQPAYAGREDLVPAGLAATDEAAAAILILPFFSTMSGEQVDRVCETLRKVVSESGAGKS